MWDCDRQFVQQLQRKKRSGHLPGPTANATTNMIRKTIERYFHIVGSAPSLLMVSETTSNIVDIIMPIMPNIINGRRPELSIWSDESLLHLYQWLYCDFTSTVCCCKIIWSAISANVENGTLWMNAESWCSSSIRKCVIRQDSSSWCFKDCSSG